VPLALLVLAVLLHAAAIDTITGRYWDGDRIGALTAFAPWPPAVVAAMATTVVAAIAVTARALRPAAMAADLGVGAPARRAGGERAGAAVEQPAPR
jgi:hypothetical protein